MRLSKLKFLIITLPLLLLGSCVKKSDSKAKKIDRLWYQVPAKTWMTEALPIGNGYMGAMFFGGIEEERIQFNEESLWIGGKGEWEAYNGGNREGAYKHLPQVRKLLEEGNYEAAHALADKELTGVIKANKGGHTWDGFGAYQAFGDVYVKTKHEGTPENYHRELNISEAIGTVNYDVGETHYSRAYFASYPKRTLVFHFTNDKTEGTDYSVRIATPHKNTQLNFEEGQLVLKGHLENNNMGFESRMLINSDATDISFSNGILNIIGAKTLNLYMTAATDYKNEYPEYTGRDYEALNQKTIAALSDKKYEDVLAEHIADYSNLYSRVALQLGMVEKDSIATDQRLANYTSGTPDPALEALFFQYGRYLLISSSRPGTMPANLQGKWNEELRPAWAADYHANINVQMIYWPAEVTNLSECHEPLIDYIDKLRAPGRQTAKDFFNADGWIVNTMNNPFGFTAPGWEFPWGFFPGGAAWYGRHVWEHYQYTQNEDFLRDKGYPIMKEAALFWLDYLTEDKEGYLISSPSYSPEHGGISTGAYMDIQMVWDLFTNCIVASDVLKNDIDFKDKLVRAKAKLLPLKIGKWGQLQEWNEDVDDPESKHRHVSHLYALYPGFQIDPINTPKLAEAAKTTLDARGDGGTGWSIGWKVNFWSRLLDGDHAHKMLKRSINYINESKGYRAEGGSSYANSGGIYSNMFSTHPPFQLDGNMGGAAGMAEMLIQSHAGTVHLLPALPTAWNTGKVSGLKARGNIEVDMQWEKGKLTRVALLSNSNTKVIVKYNDVEKEIALTNGKKINLNGEFNPVQ
ncbi:glycosyl hydrolase family 95 catalytic domain-containing protein [Maribacter sp. 2304DJ31-5]|uniref:glycoside hydrolase family 95 protein n=1 Tax=Maribacter sp. 2304DJ31-5 TaxID=3386273 RepID=UPI0039BC2A90